MPRSMWGEAVAVAGSQCARISFDCQPTAASAIHAHRISRNQPDRAAARIGLSALYGTGCNASALLPNDAQKVISDGADTELHGEGMICISWGIMLLFQQTTRIGMCRRPATLLMGVVYRHSNMVFKHLGSRFLWDPRGCPQCAAAPPTRQ